MSAARLWRITAPLAVGAALLAIWEAVVRIEDIPPYILPGPLLIAETLWTDGPSLLSSLLVTLRITLAALAAAAILGGGIALLFSLSRVLALSLFPYAVILQVTPIVAIAPLIIIWVQEPFLALLVCAWIVAFFPVVANTTVGLLADFETGPFALRASTRLAEPQHQGVRACLRSTMRCAGSLAEPLARAARPKRRRAAALEERVMRSPGGRQRRRR